MSENFAYQTIFSQHPQPMWLYDQETKNILDVNEATLQHYGYSREEFLQLSQSEISLPHTQDNQLQLHRLKNGQLIQASISSFDIDYQGRPVKTVVVKNLQSDQNTLLGLVYEFDSPGLWDHDLHADKMNWNPRMYEIFDIDQGDYTVNQREELISSRIHPNDLNRIRSDINAVLISGDQAVRRYRVVHRNGEIRTLEGISRILRNNSGQALQVHGFIRDITEFTHTQTALEAHDRLLQRLSTSVPGIIFELHQSIEGNFSLQYASNSFKRITGIDPDKLRKNAESLLELIHPLDQPQLREVYQEAILTLETNRCRFRLATIKGRERWIQCEFQPEKQPDGSRLWHGYCSDITQQLQLEDSTREIEERLRLAAEAAGIGIWEHDIKTDQIIWDLHMHEIYGIQAGAFDGRLDSWLALIHPDDLEHTLAQNTQIFRHPRESLPLEYRIIRGDGQVRHIESLAQAYLSHDGQLQRIIGINRDISHRKQAEQILSEKEAHLRASQTVGGIGSWELDLMRLDQSRSLRWSEQCSQIFGLSDSPEQISNEYFYSLIHPDDRLSVAEAMAQTLASGEYFSLEYRIIRPDGHERMILQRAEIYSELNTGRRLKLIGTVQEVSRSHQLEQDLHQSEERLKLAKEAAGLGIWEVNLDSGRVIWDAQMYKIFALTPDQFTHDMSFWKKIAHPEDYSPLDLEDLSTIGEHVRHNEHRIVLAQGEIRYLETHMCLLYNPQHKPWRLIGITRDITAQKRAEAALLTGKQQLESALDQMQGLAVRSEMANTEKSEFLNRITHELRTPLNGVIGMSDLLLMAHLDSESSTYAQIIQQSGKELCVLVDKILDFSCQKSQVYELKQSYFSLTERLSTLALELNPQLSQAGLELQFLPDPDLPDRFYGNSACLEQVLKYLLSYGEQITQTGQVQLWIRAIEKTENDLFGLFFEIQNPSLSVSSFQSFTQADAPLDQIDLTLSRSLISLLGGELKFKSSAHQGTHFWFSLDFVTSNTEPDVKENKLELEISLVSHQAQLSEWLTRCLRYWGCQVNQFKALNETPDHGILIIDWPVNQDLHWPPAELTQKQHQTCIVLIHAEQQTKLDTCIKSQVYSWLIKPIDLKTLKNLLNKISQHSESNQTVEKPFKNNTLQTRLISEQAKILVVEDNPINQLVLETMLIKQGLLVNKVENGAQALEQMQVNTFDLVLMDCQMPEMDGFEATRQIRANRDKYWNANIPIIAVSAHTLPIDREKCLIAGMNDYLGKPFTSEELEKVLKKWLPKWHQKFPTKNAGLADRATSGREP